MRSCPPGVRPVLSGRPSIPGTTWYAIARSWREVSSVSVPRTRENCTLNNRISRWCALRPCSVHLVGVFQVGVFRLRTRKAGRRCRDGLPSHRDGSLGVLPPGSPDRTQRTSLKWERTDSSQERKVESSTHPGRPGGKTHVVLVERWLVNGYVGLRLAQGRTLIAEIRSVYWLF